jgi:hypothetical protein
VSEQDVTHEIKLPSGARFTGPTFLKAWAKFFRHSRASIAEGMCPRHATALAPFPAQPGFVSGKCGDCRAYYAYELANEQVHEHFYFAGPPPWAD